MAAHADEFALNFSGPGVTGSGTLETTADASDPGANFVTSGSMMINGSEWTITGGTSAPGTYLTTAANSYDWVLQYDNVLYNSTPNLDDYGLLLTNGSDDANLFYTGSSYYLITSLASLNAATGNGIQLDTASVAPTPEPASVVYSGTAALMLAGVIGVETRRRKLAGDLA